MKYGLVKFCADDYTDDDIKEIYRAIASVIKLYDKYFKHDANMPIEFEDAIEKLEDVLDGMADK